MAIKYTINENIQKVLKDITQAKLDRAMRRIALDMKSTVQMRFRRGKAPDGSSWTKPTLRVGQPLRDSRMLEKSFATRWTSNEAKVGTNLKYARLMNYGGTVKAKRAKYLTIPIDSEAKGKSAKEFQKAFVFKSRRGNLFIATTDGHKRLRLLKNQLK